MMGNSIVRVINDWDVLDCEGRLTPQKSNLRC